LLNLAFIPGELNREIKKRSPSEYFLDYKETNKKFSETMKSHLINYDSIAAIWKNDYNQFIKERGALIFESIKSLTGGISEIENKMKTTPLEFLENLEKEMRVYLDGKMSLAFGDEYWKKVPGDIQERVKEKISELYKRHPYEQRKEVKNFEKFNFCDVMDYNQIVSVNWDIFGNDFGSRGETQKHFLNFKEYRNSLMHIRSMNRVIKKQGEASAEWLSHIIGLELEDEVSEEEAPENSDEE